MTQRLADQEPNFAVESVPFSEPWGAARIWSVFCFAVCVGSELGYLFRCQDPALLGTALPPILRSLHSSPNADTDSAMWLDWQQSNQTTFAFFCAATAYLL